jgi:two-component system nitrogen regulation response regulator GlnG
MSADLHQRQFVPVSDHRISGDALQMPEQELSSARQAHDAIDGAWEQGLIQEVQRSLASQTGIPDDSVLMDHLTRRFESIVIRTALRHTRGRRIDAASRLGIGRNTITRKIQELKLEDDHW